MKQLTDRPTVRFAVIYFTFLIALLFCSVMVFATTYYVDASGGNDINNGTSRNTAWRTLDKVNGFGFQPGDVILFKRKQTWNGQLYISSSGTAEQVITFSAYGVGNKPLIVGGGIVRDAIYIAANHIVVDGFAVTNFDGASIFDGAEARRTGIRVGQWQMFLSNIKILNNEVYFVEGCSNHPSVGAPRGTTLSPPDNNQYQNAAIYADPHVINGLTIQGNYIHDCTCTGILVSNYDATPSTNVIIRSNSIYNVGSDGLELWNSQNPLAELNAVIKVGNNSGSSPRGTGVLGSNGLAVCGLWSFFCDSPLFQYNYCEGTKLILYDGQAWDFDIGTTGTAIYQYNYSRDNEGGFNLGGESGFVFRYNISYNDGAKQGQGEGFFNGASQYYNNVFYRNDQKVFHFDNFITSTGTFTNNIFYSNATTSASYNDGGRTFSSNCFYGHTPTSPGASPVLSNPQFIFPTYAPKVPPGKILNLTEFRHLVSGFKLRPWSPCINAGTSISNNGGFDLWGNTLYSEAPDIGAYEYPVICSIPFAHVTSEITTEETMMIYPNPANASMLRADIHSDKDVEVKVNLFSSGSDPVVDMQQTLVKGNNVIQIPVQHLKNGLYVLIIDKGYERVTKRVMIDR